MKPKLLALLLACAASLFAHGESAKITGPNQGRIVTAFEPHLEVFVTAERQVRLTFVDDTGTPIGVPAGLTATLITGDRAAPTTLTFAADGATLLSTATLPAGGNLPAILRLKPSPEAAIITARFQLNLAICSGCQLPEYACTCGH
jgi:hypothetical protein